MRKIRKLLALTCESKLVSRCTPSDVGRCTMDGAKCLSETVAFPAALRTIRPRSWRVVRASPRRETSRDTATIRRTASGGSITSVG